MFNVGFTELLVLGVIGLLVLGPEQLPVVARKLARILNDLKRAKDEIMSPVEDLKTEARQMLDRARELARQNELDEIVRKSMEPDKSPSHKPGPDQVTVMPHPTFPLENTPPVDPPPPVTDAAHPVAKPEPVLPPTIGTPKKDV